MIYVPKNDAEAKALQQIVERKLGITLGMCACLGVLSPDQKQLRAIAVFNNYRGRNIELSFVAMTPRWATRLNILTVLWYAFGQIGVARVTCLVRRSNKRARKLLEGVGFQPEGRLRQADSDGAHLLIYGLLASEYEQLVERYHGKQVESEPASGT